MSDKRIHILVSGLVQGVFFRAYTRKTAEKYGLTGWVRNLSDGRVEIVAEGPEESLLELLEWSKKGSPHAKVQGVRYRWLPYTGEYTNFDISPTARSPLEEI